MIWHLSHRFDRRALPLADRHYNRQKPGTPQFVAPGRNLVLVDADATALWVTSWPFAEYTKHAWSGAWVCSIFRNESPALSSLMIVDAVAATRALYGEPPRLGMVTFVDPEATRHKRDPGRCFRKAGFKYAGLTKRRGYVSLLLAPEDMPPPRPALGSQLALFGERVNLRWER